MKHLEKLENKSIFILREAYACFSNLAMLWSVGKDSTVLVHLARKAFLGHVPFPLVHIDTNFKVPEMIKYRDELAIKWKLNMVYGMNEEAIKNKNTYPDGKLSRIECCKNLKTFALKKTLDGTGIRYKMNHEKKKYEKEEKPEPYTGLILGIRADEEGSRSKERYFSPRGLDNDWNIAQQPPEFWDQYNTEFPPKTHVRIHPLLDWTELNIWEYIQKENIPVVSLYFNQGKNKRYRSLGCAPCTYPIDSSAKDTQDIIDELKTGKLSNIAERSGRAQDKEDGGGLETLRKDGYM
ncbi:MAG: Sulfate adenylyltransferase subunit 2 [Candidatus Anoxychlamydiales bacterium]|nr:Sulfate adenylyltransferase subunit 2 [Candidatus Anoxychlamydiales bacterium]